MFLNLLYNENFIPSYLLGAGRKHFRPRPCQVQTTRRTKLLCRRAKRRRDAAISSRHLRLRRGFPVLRPVLRDCRALLRKARNDKLGCLSHSEGRSAELASAALPCHCEERSDVGISSRHLRFRRGPAVPALTAVYRITKPGHVLRRVPVLCAYCSAYFFV